MKYLSSPDVDDRAAGSLNPCMIFFEGLTWIFNMNGFIYNYIMLSR